MKVLLMNPPKFRLMNTNVSYFPMNLGSLAGSLANNGTEVKIYNAELSDAPDINVYSMSFVEKTELQAQSENMDFDSSIFGEVLEEMRRVVLEYQPEALGITCMSGDYLIATYLTEKFWEISPNCSIVMGGSHVSSIPKESLVDSVDLILVGQPENTFIEFLLNLDPQHVAANICQPLPRTELFAECVEKNQLDGSKINNMLLTTHSTTNNYTDIPYERFLELMKESRGIVDGINKKNQAYEEGLFLGQNRIRNENLRRPVANLDQ